MNEICFADFMSSLNAGRNMAKKNSQSGRGGKKRYHIEATSLTLFLWGFCALFLMAWIFVLGIFVGRGFLPGADGALMDLKNQVAKLQEMMAGNKRVEPESQKKESIDEMLAFYEKLESKKDEAKRKEQGTPPASNGAGSGTSEGKVAEAPKKDSHGKVEPLDPGQGELRAAPKPGKGAYTLQVASLEDRQKAESMVRDLTSRGYDAYFYEVKVKGKAYYRVRCGRFVTRDEAGAFVSKLFRETKIRGIISRIE